MGYATGNAVRSGHEAKWAGHPYAVTGVTREAKQHVRNVVADSAAEALETLTKLDLVWDCLSARLMTRDEAVRAGLGKYCSGRRKPPQ